MYHVTSLMCAMCFSLYDGYVCYDDNAILHGAVNSSRIVKKQHYQLTNNRQRVKRSTDSEMPYVFRQGDLPKLDLQVDRGTDFKAWKTQGEAYINLSGLDKEEQSKQVQALTLCFSRETLTIVENLGLTVTQRGNVKDIVDAIQRYVEGHINESVERRNFRRRTGESFDDFLVALRELAKTCKFCSDACTQTNIRDQIIEGLIDGDAVEDLLKEKDLTLETTITKCRGQEAAKRQRAEISGATAEAVMAIRKTRPEQFPTHAPTRACPGCGGNFHQGGRRRCPAYNLTCHLCQKIGHMAKVCRSKRQISPQTPTHPSAKALHAALPTDRHTPQLNTSKCGSTKAIEPAPTICVLISSLNGTAEIETLPDSGADLSVAGKVALTHLGEHQDNLLPSNITPRAVNGTKMQPIGKLPVTLMLGTKTYTDELHIYPEVTGILLSWKAAKGLNILPA